MELFDFFSDFSPEAYLITKLADATLAMVANSVTLQAEANAFLREDPASLNRRYSNEQGQIGGFLPYSFLHDWREQILDQRTPDINLIAQAGEFARSDGSNDWAEISMKGWLERKEKHSGGNSTVIRLSKATVQDGAMSLHIQRAKYQDQARSNLILDYRSDKGASLRDILDLQYPEELPPLNDPRLANTLGAALVLLYEDDGAVMPLLAHRAQNVSVFGNTVHLPTSCAIEWQEGRSTSFEDLIVADLIHEVQQEAGLDFSQGDFAAPVPLALCREYLRGGKPQLFFLSATKLKKEELVKRRNEKMREMAKFKREKMEFKEKSFVPRKGYWFEPKVDPSNWLKGPRSIEAACALYLAQSLLAAWNSR